MTTKSNVDEPARLLESILAEPDPNSRRVGVLANKLLAEYHRGYPINNLRLLLRSRDERLVNTGVWIASELGEKGKALLDDVSPLLAHPHKRTRFFAIDCILLWAGPSNKSDLASVIALMDDPEPAVRWKAMDFLSRASGQQLQAALSHLKVKYPGPSLIRGLQWLLSSDAVNPKAVAAALQSQDPYSRKYGVVAASRMSERNTEPLFYASTLDDPDVKDFATSTIRRITA
jgi:hypothetical protein